MSNPADLVWINMIDGDYFWKGKITGFRIGENDDLPNNDKANFYLRNPRDAIYDTGTSLLYLPQNIDEIVAERLLRSVSVTQESGLTLVPCSPSTPYESFWLRTGDEYWMEIPPETYIMDIGESVCVYGITTTSSDYFLLGDVFLRNYYSIHDDDNGLIGLAPHANSVATPLAIGPLGPYEYFDAFDWTRQEKITFYLFIGKWVGIGYGGLGALLVLLRFTGGFDFLVKMNQKWQEFTNGSLFRWFGLLFNIFT